MKKGTALIVPGLNGSGEAHWQTWLERQLPGARRVTGIDWQEPVLAHWAGAVRDAIDRASGPVWLVAHSYGCLAAVVAGADRSDRVAGALFVAPADPDRFTAIGFKEGAELSAAASLSSALPLVPLGFPSIMAISCNDPWLKVLKAIYWANNWGSHIVSIGQAGHINAESGYGPWPQGLALLHSLQASQDDFPLGSLEEYQHQRKGRHGALAKLRHRTRKISDTAIRR